MSMTCTDCTQTSWWCLGNPAIALNLLQGEQLGKGERPASAALADMPPRQHLRREHEEPPWGYEDVYNTLVKAKIKVNII